MAKGTSIILCLAVAALITLGLVVLASASATWDSSSEQYSYLVRQIGWLVIGVGVMITMALIDYRILQKFAWPMFVVVCVALALCYVPGIGDEVGGAKRWIKLPLIGRFQPSEAAKLVVMVALASWLAK